MLNSGKAIKEKHITLLKREPVLKINLENLLIIQLVVIVIGIHKNGGDGALENGL